MLRRVCLALIATLVSTGFAALARFGWDGPFLPELMAQILFANVPVWAFTPLFRLFGQSAKYWAFAGMVGLHLLGWTAFGAWLMTRRGWTMLGGLIALFALSLAALPLAGAGWFGSALGSGPVGAILTLALAVLGYGLLLGLRRASPPQSVSGRRGFLRTAGFAIAVLVGVTVIGRAIAHAAAEIWNAIVGLPPEIVPVGRFYTVSKNIFDPSVNPAKWSLEIKGLVDRPFRIAYEELRTLPAVEQYATLMCISNEVGGDLISNGHWKGVRLKDLLTRAGIKPGAVEVILRAADGYSDSFPLKKGLEDGVRVVYEMNGKPLAKQHGAPARVIVPGIYGMKNVKWVTSIELAEYDYKGYWENRGWSDEAVYRTMSRIDAPQGAVKAGQKTWIAGVAFAGDRGIRDVEVATDGGRTWQKVEVKPPLGPFTWVLWALPWTPPAPGSYALVARAIEKNGSVQTSEERPPLPDGASGWHRVTVRAT